jgi:hypothetical protein
MLSPDFTGVVGMLNVAMVTRGVGAFADLDDQAWRGSHVSALGMTG